MCQIISRLKKFIAVGTPLIAIDSADHPHITNAIREGIDRPIVRWDAQRQFTAVNEEGDNELVNLDDKDRAKVAKLGMPAALEVSTKFGDVP